MFKRFNSSSPWVWMSAGMLSLSLIAVLGVMSLIGWKGLSYFWPAPLYEFSLKTELGTKRFFGQIYDKEKVPTQQLIEAGVSLDARAATHQARWLIKIANQSGQSQFLSVLEQNILSFNALPNLMILETNKQGILYGIPAFLREKKTQASAGLSLSDYPLFLGKVATLKKALAKNKEALSLVSAQLETQRESFKSQPLQLKEQHLLERLAHLKKEQSQLLKKQTSLEQHLAQYDLGLDNSLGKTLVIPASQIKALWFPNAMTGLDKFEHWLNEVKQFITGDLRETSGEGGVFPAIFGTVLMVLLMSLMVMPLGVLAAVYLHEYAKKNTLTRLIRIAVVNLAGVPSIVYGVFGLGFFVYFLGGNIDALFYADVLPRPTFGTPGLLWSSLTLAILTLPVVIVSTEEGLARIPLSVRYGSFALGATKAETLRQIILPMASPAIMTGLILAIARAAGEVAPLMLVGVVKVAPSLPLDSNFPYLHLDRKFMHLGYHIYDAGFQSANNEAARPLVYATSFLLVTVIVSLNLTAISIRHHLREKYRALSNEA